MKKEGEKLFKLHKNTSEAMMQTEVTSWASNRTFIPSLNISF